MKIISRKEAVEMGLREYFTGKPCKYGHVCPRKVVQNRCVECTKLSKLEYYRENREVLIEKSRNIQVRNKEKRKEYMKRYANENREKLRSYLAEYYANNKDKFEICKIQQKTPARILSRKIIRNWRLKNDPSYIVNVTVRNMLHRVIKVTKQNKNDSTFTILGYSAVEFKEHIESMWVEGMCWENHGEWHIDHIKSIKQHLTEGVDDIKIINALTNLQPLWAFDNLSKGA